MIPYGENSMPLLTYYNVYENVFFFILKLDAYYNLRDNGRNGYHIKFFFFYSRSLAVGGLRSRNCN